MITRIYRHKTCLNIKFMNKEFKKLRSVLQELHDVAVSTGDQFGVNKLDRCFFNAANDGSFIQLPPKEQIRWIGGGVFACFLGRGERIWSDIENGHLPEDFPDKMCLAAWMYYITLDISEKDKSKYREEISRILEKR